MDVLGIDRVMLATPDIDGTADRFSELLGISFSDLTPVMPPGIAGDRDVYLSSTGFQLVGPGDGDGPVAHFLEEHGPGVFAIGVRVADLDAAKAALDEHGVQPLDEDVREDFAEAFYPPETFNGVMTILTEYDPPHPSVVAADPSVDYGRR